jgi:hypothetical protein
MPTVDCALKKKKAKRVQVIEQGGQLYELYR